jgi:primosomal protein N' (replication factor Y)
MEHREANPDKAEEEAHKLADRLKVRLEAGGFHQTEMIGPVPCFFARENGEYRWQIVLRGPDPAAALKDLHANDWRVEVDPISIL